MQTVHWWAHGRGRGQTADTAWTRWSRQRKSPVTVQTAGNTDTVKGSLITCCIWILTKSCKNEGKPSLWRLWQLTLNTYRNNLWHFHRNFTLYCSLRNSNHFQPVKSFTFVILNFQCLVLKSSGTGTSREESSNMSGWSSFIIFRDSIHCMYIV